MGKKNPSIYVYAEIISTYDYIELQTVRSILRRTSIPLHMPYMSVQFEKSQSNFMQRKKMVCKFNRFRQLIANTLNVKYSKVDKILKKSLLTM